MRIAWVLAAGRTLGRLFTRRGYRAAFDGAAIGLARVNDEGRLLRVNAAFSRLLGYTAADLRGKTLSDLTDAADRTAEVNAVTSGERRFVHRSGRLVPVLLTFSRAHSAKAGPHPFVCVCQDLTPSAEADYHFRWLVDASPMGVVHAHRDGTVIRANDAFYRLLGWSAEEFSATRQTMRTITPAEWMAVSDALIDSAGESGAEVVYEKEYVRRDGSRIPVMIALSRDRKGNDMLLAFVLDLRRQKNIEAALRASENKLRFAQSAAGAAMYDLDLASGSMDWTEENYSLFGIDPGTPMTRDIWFSKIVPDDQPHVRRARELAISDGVDIDVEYRVRPEDGVIRWIHAKARLVRDAANNPVRLVGLNFDITKRKQAEIAIQNNELRIRGVADAMPQIVWTSQTDLQVNYYNRRWYEYTGIVPGGGDNAWAPVVHPMDLQSCIELGETSLREGRASDLHCRLRRADGTYRWHLVRSVPLRNDAGEVTEWVGTSTDVDDYKRLNDELEQRVQERTAQLESSLNEQEVLLKEVQHRVKNNLQIICSIVGMQIECAVDRTAVAPLIEAQGRIYAMALVHQQLHESNNLLALNLAAYVEPLTEQLFEAYGVSGSRIRLHCSIEPLHLPVVQAIPCGLILNELLSNALKHAFPSGVQGEITVSFGQSPESGRLFLCVADNGPGLPEGFQAAETRSLGFQIVTAMARQLNAELEVRGRDGTSVRMEWATAE